MKTPLTYKQTKNLISENYSKFPIKWAFSNEQLKDVLKELEVESTKDLIKVIAGGLIRKTDLEAYKKMRLENDNLMINFLNSSYENILQGMIYELQNHEYGYTYEIEPALSALGLEYSTLTEIQLKALNEAKKMKYHEC